MPRTTASLARLATAVAVATALGTPGASAAPEDHPQGPPADPAPADVRANRGSIWLSGEGGTAPGHHPHPGCGDILVWGAKLADAGGTYKIRALPPTGTRAVVATGTWAAPADGAPAPVTTATTVVTLAAAGPVDEELLAGGDATLVLGTRVSRPGALPLTGGNWAAIIATGMLLTGTGTLLVRRSRRAGDGDGMG